MGDVRLRIHDMFHNPHSQRGKLVNDMLAVTTIVSIVGGVSASLALLTPYLPLLRAVEWVTILVFTLEYGARVYASTKRSAYVLSFMGLVDLVAILPSYIGLGPFTFLKVIRAARVLRFVKLLGQTNVSRVRDKGQALLERFGVATASFAIVNFGVAVASFVLFLVLQAVSEGGRPIDALLTAFTHFFIGTESVPLSVGIPGALLFVLGKLCLYIALGLFVEVVYTHCKRWRKKGLA